MVEQLEHWTLNTGVSSSSPWLASTLYHLGKVLYSNRSVVRKVKEMLALYIGREISHAG